MQWCLTPGFSPPSRGQALTLTLPSASPGTSRERIGNESERPCGTGILDSRAIVSHSGFPAGCEGLAAAAAWTWRAMHESRVKRRYRASQGAKRHWAAQMRWPCLTYMDVQDGQDRACRTTAVATVGLARNSVNAAQNSSELAISAPSRMALSLSQTMPASTRLEPAEVSKPQSVPASTRVGSPPAAATA